MTSRSPIQTAIGTLWGRDCIYLDRMMMPNTSTLVLEGTINTSIVKGLATPREMPPDEDLPYVFTFSGVLAHQMLELDSWQCQNNDDDNAFMDSSFEEIVGSPWLASLGGKLTPEHRHFSVLTYDDVIDVICRGVDLAFTAKAVQQKNAPELPAGPELDSLPAH